MPSIHFYQIFFHHLPRQPIWDVEFGYKRLEVIAVRLRDKKRAFLSIPIPTIFLAENNDDTFEVIDGQQRLTTIFAFMKSKLVANEIEKLSENLREMDVLTLSGLETLKQFNWVVMSLPLYIKR